MWNGGPIATDELGGMWKLSIMAQNCEGGWGELCNERLNNLYSSPNIFRMIGSRRMRHTRHVACIQGMTNIYIIVFNVSVTYFCYRKVEQIWNIGRHLQNMIFARIAKEFPAFYGAPKFRFTITSSPLLLIWLIIARTNFPLCCNKLKLHRRILFSFDDSPLHCLDTVVSRTESAPRQKTAMERWQVDVQLFHGSCRARKMQV
jgi:hypothetical protein